MLGGIKARFIGFSLFFSKIFKFIHNNQLQNGTRFVFCCLLSQGVSLTVVALDYFHCHDQSRLIGIPLSNLLVIEVDLINEALQRRVELI